MPIATPEIIARRVPNLTEDALAFFAGFRDDAETTARQLLGENPYSATANDDFYDDVVAAGSTAANYRTLQRAEADLAMFYGLGRANLRMAEQGGVITAVGNPQSGTKQLSEENEIAKKRQRFYSDASSALTTLRAALLNAADSSRDDDPVQTVWVT